MNAGKWVIVGMFGLGLAAASLAWLNRVLQSDQTTRLWGAETLDLIENAPLVELVVHDGRGGDERRLDVTRARGTPNIRHTLGRDFAYEGAFAKPETAQPAKWVLVFSDGARKATLGFSEDCHVAILGDDKHAAKLVDAAAKLLRAYFKELDAGG
jgi:hypothetical protein